jgi:hypothetical protein
LIVATGGGRELQCSDLRFHHQLLSYNYVLVQQFELPQHRHDDVSFRCCTRYYRLPAPHQRQRCGNHTDHPSAESERYPRLALALH